MNRVTRYFIAVFSVLALAWPVYAGDASAEAPQVDIKSMLFGHIGDSYEWHITTVGDKDIVIPLPVIVHSSTGWHCFLSSRLEDGPYEGLYCASGGRYDGKIVERNADGNEVRPFDISITKNVAGLMINGLIVVLLILGCSRWYRKHDVLNEAPTGLAAVIEPVVTFINDDVVKNSIPEEHSARYAPYLLTVFFFILVNNLMGIVPVFPGPVVAESPRAADSFHGTSRRIYQTFRPDDKAFCQYHGWTCGNSQFCLDNFPDGADGSCGEWLDVIHIGHIRHFHGFSRVARRLYTGLCFYNAFGSVHRSCP